MIWRIFNNQLTEFDGVVIRFVWRLFLRGRRKGLACLVIAQPALLSLVPSPLLFYPALLAKPMPRC